MDTVVQLRETGTVGEVIDHILDVHYPTLPEKMYRREKEVSEEHCKSMINKGN
jgi:hypothetical protein